MAAILRAALASLLVQSGLTAVLRAGRRAGLLQPGEKPALRGYSFAQFVRDYGRSYVAGSEEYASRAAQFEASIARINEVNSKNSQEGRAWTSGVHPFMDWYQHERVALISGYKGSRRARSPSTFAAIQTNAGARASARLNATMGADGASWGESVIVRNQGSCGSCWAFSAMEAIEARLPANTRLSAQALIDCTPNPQHCGGKGGCDGATGELAYAWVKDNGIPLESSYDAYNQRTGTCQASSGPRARISGWTTLPQNKVDPLMQAVYNQGPVAVSVDGSPWFDYDSGVFDGCQKDAILGHGVLLKGYGGEGNGMFWNIQNSWGSNWGERGHIRLRRRPPAEEEAYCGTDNKPEDGVACPGGPPSITVCGMCGILYDGVYPEGVTLDGADSGGIAASPSTETTAFDAFKPEAFKSDFSKPDAFEPWHPAEAAKSVPTDTVGPQGLAKSDVDIMKNIFRPKESADKVQKDMEKDAVAQMEAMFRR